MAGAGRLSWRGGGGVRGATAAAALLLLLGAADAAGAGARTGGAADAADEPARMAVGNATGGSGGAGAEDGGGGGDEAAVVTPAGVRWRVFDGAWRPAGAVAGGAAAAPPAARPPLPVSVVIPLGPKRLGFFEKYVVPAIEANAPAEVIVEAGNPPECLKRGTAIANCKRNAGARKATQPYLFFWDDDCVMAADALAALHAALEAAPSVDFAYTDYWGIVLRAESHWQPHNFLHRAAQFDAALMERQPYVDTLTLVRTASFWPGFDGELKRLQDYDMWLSLVRRGGSGVKVEGDFQHKYYVDAGISSKGDLFNRWKDVLDKHGLGPPFPGFDTRRAWESSWIAVEARGREGAAAAGLSQAELPHGERTGVRLEADALLNDESFAISDVDKVELQRVAAYAISQLNDNRAADAVAAAGAGWAGEGERAAPEPIAPLSLARWERIDRAADVSKHTVEYTMDLAVRGDPLANAVTLHMVTFADVRIPPIVHELTAARPRREGARAQTVHMVMPLYERKEEFEGFVARAAALRGDFRLVLVDYSPAEVRAPALAAAADAGVRIDRIDRSHESFNGSRAIALRAGIDKIAADAASAGERDEVVFAVDTDMELPPDFVSTILARVVPGRRVFVPVCFSFHQGRSRDTLVAAAKAKGVPWNRPQHLYGQGWWRSEGSGMMAAYLSDLIAVGSYDETITGYGTEDTDLMTRFEKAGYQVYRSKEPFYYHLWHPPSRFGGHQGLHPGSAVPDGKAKADSAASAAGGEGAASKAELTAEAKKPEVRVHTPTPLRSKPDSGFPPLVE